ncbi:MAG TPA: exodeoxyribonuclease III [Flavobacteriales bacterium]|jgi:exodeoxyribonuclease-3|nr:exodeoxyribonuclease III [Flavobacteriales bacterium]
MKIISYNVNGIRAAMRKGLVSWLQQVNADVVGFQEIKAQEHQIDTEALKQAGYLYQYWFPAQKKGYSGTGIISKVKPNNVVFGTDIDYMDFEGRNIRADFDNFSFMSMYLPSGTNDERLAFKFKYMDDFLDYVKTLSKNIPNLIISGDYNICHQPIDIHDPVRLRNVSGFLPEEREWLSRFIDSGFVDSFREFDPRPHQYTWWSYRAASRERNKGWRIDYHMVTPSLQKEVKRSIILPEAKHSDHCPILIEL